MLSATDVSSWCGFVGAWLLVAGPVFQGALELHAQEIDREALHEVARSVPAPERISPWWWLVPPVLYVLTQQRKSRHRDLTFAAMTVKQREDMIVFVSKAHGWFMVAGGGTLLACKDTWQLVQRYALPAWVFWVGASVMVTLCMLNTAIRMNNAQRIVNRGVMPGPGPLKRLGDGP